MPFGGLVHVPRMYLASRVWMATLQGLLIFPSTATAQDQPQGPPLRDCRDIERLPGLLWKGTERRMPLQRLVSYGAPVSSRSQADTSCTACTRKVTTCATEDGC